jgi:hypothetical protein
MAGTQRHDMAVPNISGKGRKSAVPITEGDNVNKSGFGNLGPDLTTQWRGVWV